MKKLFKRITLVLLTVCAVFACAFAVSACGNKESGYTFVIQYEDGTALNAENVETQICDDSGCKPLFLKGIYPDANGKITLTQAQVNEICGSDTDVTKFAFHVINVDGYNPDCSFEVDGAKEYICKLYK